MSAGGFIVRGLKGRPGRRFWEGNDQHKISTGYVFTREREEARRYADKDEAAGAWSAWAPGYVTVEPYEEGQAS